MKKGFTLSEILIVISIIGILSVLTIPSLTNSVHTSKIKTTLKKGFSSLANAYAVEFTAKPAPATQDDGEKMMGAIINQMSVKYYLTCNSDNCEQQYTQQPAGSWVITDDNIAYKVIQGGKDCAQKASINQLESSADTLAETCLAVLIDAGCIAKNNDESSCFEIEDGTEDLVSKIKNNKYEGEQIKAFVTSTGITAGNPDAVAAGIITED